MTGIIVTTPPTVELPPGSTTGGSAVLPGVTYTYAVLGLPQTWTAKQTFPLGNISVQAGDVAGLAASATTDTTNAGNITFTQTGTGAVSRSVSSKLGDVISATDFGAKGDGGTNNVAFIDAAIAATPAGGTLVFPPGLFFIDRAGAEVFLINKAITIEGTRHATIFYLGTSILTTTDIFHFTTTAPNQGGGLRNFNTVPVSGIRGQHFLRVTTNGNTSASWTKFRVEGVDFYQTNGLSVFYEGRSDGVGVFGSTFKDCSFASGVKLQYVGDSMEFEGTCQFSGSNAGLYVSQIAGSGGVVVGDACNFTATGAEQVIIDSAIRPVIGGLYEHISGALTGSGMINLRGSVAAVDSAIINAQIQVPTSGRGNPNTIYIGAATDTSIQGSRVHTWGGVSHIVNSASAARTVIEGDNVWLNQGTPGNLAITDSGSGTKYSPRATSYGTTTTVLHGAATGVGVFGAVALTADVSGTLPIGNGGTGVATGAVVSVKKQIFTSSGTYIPSTGMIYAVIECVGSGGGGGSAAGTVGNIFSGGGGGSGSYSRLVVPASSIGASQTVTIGAAGAGGASGSNNGGNGADVSVGALCIGKGGSGGKFGSIAQGPTAGAGGVAGTGDLTAAGSPGSPGFYNAANTAIAFPSGNGGSSIFGGGAQGVTASAAAAAGNTATNYGGGGSGAVASGIAANAAGGDGSKGIAFITDFNSQ